MSSCRHGDGFVGVGDALSRAPHDGLVAEANGLKAALRPTSVVSKIGKEDRRR
jgi:hypothetical protein